MDPSRLSRQRKTKEHMEQDSWEGAGKHKTELERSGEQGTTSGGVTEYHRQPVLQQELKGNEDEDVLYVSDSFSVCLQCVRACLIVSCTTCHIVWDPYLLSVVPLLCRWLKNDLPTWGQSVPLFRRKMKASFTTAELTTFYSCHIERPWHEPSSGQWWHVTVSYTTLDKCLIAIESKP